MLVVQLYFFEKKKQNVFYSSVRSTCEKVKLATYGTHKAHHILLNGACDSTVNFMNGWEVKYCKTGNFRATLIFALFAHFWANAKLKCSKIFILCVGLWRIAEKSEFKNKRKC